MSFNALLNMVQVGPHMMLLNFPLFQNSNASIISLNNFFFYSIREDFFQKFSGFYYGKNSSLPQSCFFIRGLWLNWKSKMKDLSLNLTRSLFFIFDPFYLLLILECWSDSCSKSKKLIWKKKNYAVAVIDSWSSRKQGSFQTLLFFMKNLKIQ